MRILVAEDEPPVTTALTVALHREGWSVDVATDLVDARWLSGEIDYDALVVDVNLPGGNGIDFCRELRGAGISTPVVILTSQSEVGNRVRGLDSGADDFLHKPFSAAELCARLRALGRRSRVVAEPPLSIGELTVDPARRVVTRDGQGIHLATREFAFVLLLARHPGATVTRAEIVEELWDFATEPDPNTLDVLVRSVRVKVDRPFATQLLHTVRGVGYRLGPPARPAVTRRA